MVDKLKQVLPLALSVGVLAFAWIEMSMNLTFHWFDNGALGNGLGLPANFHLIAPAAFITWAMVFAAGADAAAATKVGIATRSGPSPAWFSWPWGLRPLTFPTSGASHSGSEFWPSVLSPSRSSTGTTRPPHSRPSPLWCSCGSPQDWTAGRRMAVELDPALSRSPSQRQPAQVPLAACSQLLTRGSSQARSCLCWPDASWRTSRRASPGCSLDPARLDTWPERPSNTDADCGQPHVQRGGSTTIRVLATTRSTSTGRRPA